ncbi:hypothetical protein CRUP_027503 [Coryphaenoides rupestris]|nr:hypothetical protein CRUP_027503 [Coryphaenoides rupestris]
MKEAVSSPAVASCAGKLFVIGGGPDDNTCSDKVQCYDPEEDTWLLRANIPIAKRCITAVSLSNLIYVAGGLTKSIFCYDPVGDYWMHVVHTFSKLEMGRGMAATPVMMPEAGSKHRMPSDASPLSARPPRMKIFPLHTDMPQLS